MAAEPPRLEAGLSAHGECDANGYCSWFPPEDADGGSAGLMVNNTLVRDRKVPLKPRDGRRLLWYTCGPTVYDVAHMGHARAYLTFDILRRILEDYFGYEVVYQVNITDIDDKIITRARRNELVRRYIARAKASADVAGTVGAKVVAAARDALTQEESKLQAARDEHAACLAAAPGDGKTARDAANLETAAKEQELKTSQATEALGRAEAAVASGADVDALVASAQDALAAALDAEEGASIGGATAEDHAIFREHATRFESLFHEDMDALGVRPPTILTRVSEYVPQVVAYIQGIEAKGFAYASKGSVYFDAQAFAKAGFTYRKLEPMARDAWDTLKAGAPSDFEEGKEKKSPMDFALWKSSKAGEPAWESPWGLGRPGWHIECSAMATDVLGPNLDIHAGGEDLCFPHHDNEMAQSEAFCGCKQWVNYFFHAGHLHIRGLKMSKSLKNFVTIRQALEEHTASQIRMLFLMQNWDRPMLYSDQMVMDAKSKEAMLRNFFGAVKALMRSMPAPRVAQVTQSWTGDEESLHADLRACQTKVHASLCDNFDTPKAMEALFSLVSSANKYLNKPGRTEPRVMLLRSVSLYVTQILRVFGIHEGADEVGLGSGGGEASKEDLVSGYLDALVHFRDEIRAYARTHKATGLLEMCDAIRDGALVDLGVRVEDRNLSDGQGGSLWKLENPSVLRKELEEKREKQREIDAKKRKNKADKLSKELKKWEGVVGKPPALLFAEDARFSKWDERGLPTETAEGAPVSKSVAKKLAKEMDKHATLYAQLQEKPGGPEAFVAGLRDEIEALRS